MNRPRSDYRAAVKVVETLRNDGLDEEARIACATLRNFFNRTDGPALNGGFDGNRFEKSCGFPQGTFPSEREYTVRAGTNGRAALLLSGLYTREEAQGIADTESAAHPDREYEVVRVQALDAE